jgi:hypothetical protein
MSLAYCNKCLSRIDDCHCHDGPFEPYIYGEIRRAVELDRRERKTSTPNSGSEVTGVVNTGGNVTYTQKDVEKLKEDGLLTETSNDSGSKPLDEVRKDAYEEGKLAGVELAVSKMYLAIVRKEAVEEFVEWLRKQDTGNAGQSFRTSWTLKGVESEANDYLSEGGHDE